MAFITIDDKTKETKIVKNLKILDKSFVLSGIFKDAGTYPGKPWPVAQIAFWNEFGTKTAPARPWMRSAIDVNLPKINALQKKLEFEILSRQVSPEKGLNILGLFLNEKFRGRIQTAQSWAAALAPSTARSKLGGGAVRGPVPLITTTRMLRSVKWKTVMRGVK